MFRKFIIFCVIICTVTASSQVNSSITDDPAKFISESFQMYTGNNDPTTTSLPTTPPTPEPTTTPATTTSTSTTSTTTTSTTTTSTTNKPTTTPHTTPTPVTTPKPFPSPQIGNWNTTCIMLKMAAQFNITYETKDNKNMTGFLNLPTNAIVEDGTCSDVLQTITLQWGSDEDVNSLHFVFNSENNTYFVSTISSEIQLIGDEFPNAKENSTVRLTHTGAEFITPMKMSYECNQEQDLNLTRVLTEKPSSFIKLMKLQLEAFSTDNKAGFSTAKDCNPHIIQDAIPIAVGLALSLLILIVLISFLVARRRSSARGYMSF